MKIQMPPIQGQLLLKLDQGPEVDLGTLTIPVAIETVNSEGGVDIVLKPDFKDLREHLVEVGTYIETSVSSMIEKANAAANAEEEAENE